MNKKNFHKENNGINLKKHREVIIIGNGPSAITLSYILAGNCPFFLNNSESSKLINEELYCRLMEADQTELFNYRESKLDLKCNKNNFLNSDSDSIDSQINELDLNDNSFDKENLGFNEIDEKFINVQIVQGSLIERNLEYLSSGLTGRSSNPVSLLFDQLQHPDADLGEHNPSCLKWKYCSENKIDHLVIGKGMPGGTWQKMHNCTEILTISVSSWMELPNFSIKKWSKNQIDIQSVLDNRVPISQIANYYCDYVNKQNLSQYFLNNCQVDSLRFCEKYKIWYLSCIDELTQEKLTFSANNLVLATGNSDKPNKLNVPGENLAFVKYYLNDLEFLLNEHKLTNESKPILIVGSGLSAADAILASLQNNLKVFHVFRKHPDDAGLIFNQLPQSIYPEYQKVHKLMKGEIQNNNYKPFSLHCVDEIKPNFEIVLINRIDKNSNLKTSVKISYVFCLIGMKPDLKFIKPKKLRQSLCLKPKSPLNYRTNPIKINPFTHEISRVKQMYSIGPLVGDNFVRFLQGGPLAISSDLIKKKKLKKISS